MNTMPTLGEDLGNAICIRVFNRAGPCADGCAVSQSDIGNCRISPIAQTVSLNEFAAFLKELTAVIVEILQPYCGENDIGKKAEEQKLWDETFALEELCHLFRAMFLQQRGDFCLIEEFSLLQCRISEIV